MTVRRHGAAESRSRLFEAAKQLFAEHGYEHAKVREIGQHANVDPALIARYFGSKAALYLEALRPEDSDGKPVELTSAAAVQMFLDRIAPKGPTPALHAAIRPHDDPELQSTAISLLRNRLLDPFEERATRAGLDDPQLRSETRNCGHRRDHHQPVLSRLPRTRSRIDSRRRRADRRPDPAPRRLTLASAVRDRALGRA